MMKADACSEANTRANEVRKFSTEGVKYDVGYFCQHLLVVLTSHTHI